MCLYAVPRAIALIYLTESLQCLFNQLKLSLYNFKKDLYSLLPACTLTGYDCTLFLLSLFFSWVCPLVLLAWCLMEPVATPPPLETPLKPPWHLWLINLQAAGRDNWPKGQGLCRPPGVKTAVTSEQTSRGQAGDRLRCFQFKRKGKRCSDVVSLWDSKTSVYESVWVNIYMLIYMPKCIEKYMVFFVAIY